MVGHTTGFLFSLIHELEKQLFSTFKVPPHQYPILLKFSITVIIRLNEKKTLFLLSYKLYKRTHRKANKLNFENINIKYQILWFYTSISKIMIIWCLVAELLIGQRDKLFWVNVYPFTPLEENLTIKFLEQKNV